MQINEREEHRVNGDVDSKKTTLMPGGSGAWQVYDVRERTSKGDAQSRTTEEKISQRDSEGRVSPLSQVITKENNAKDQQTVSTQTYSADIAGSAGDGTLRPLSQTTTVRKTEHGRAVTEQVEQPAPGNPEPYFGTFVKTMDVTAAGSSGSEETITVTARNPDGSPSVVSVATRKSDQPPPSK